MPLPKLKEIQWVTVDCYGTLIDWEKGITDAFTAEGKRDGFSFDDGPFVERFFDRGGRPPLRNRHAMPGEELLALVLK